MGVARDLTGDYQRGLLTLTISALLAAAMTFVIRVSLHPKN
jgi:hypothetical protein